MPFLRLVSLGIILFAALNIGLDYLFTRFQNSSFYFSESLLFSSYWILFLPFVLLFIGFSKKVKLVWKLTLLVLAIGLHFFCYPAFIWLASKIFFSHTFPYWQTFNYALTAYFLKSIIVYGFVFGILNYRKPKLLIKQDNDLPVVTTNSTSSIRSIIITDSYNRKHILPVSEISYFSANPPYIFIHFQTKKFLHSETLKSMEKQLDPECFVRIHKSAIVNLEKIVSYQSRQNGDYDLTLADGVLLRLSRTYAKNFLVNIIKIIPHTSK